MLRGKGHGRMGATITLLIGSRTQCYTPFFYFGWFVISCQHSVLRKTKCTLPSDISIYHVLVRCGVIFPQSGMHMSFVPASPGTAFYASIYSTANAP